MDDVATTLHLDAAWTRRLTLYPRLLLGTVGLAFVIVIMAGDGSSTAGGRVGGDFPAFYSAGTIVADGNIDDLYDPVTQAAAQDQLLGREDGFIMFPYAPHVAAAYSAFSGLPYRLAYVIHTLLMVGALVGALALLRPMIPLVDRWFSLVLGAAVGAYPIFVGVSGGQNTALTLLLLAAIWRSLHDDRQVLAGLAVAVLLFRPQYAIPVLGLLFLGRYWRAVASSVAGAGVIWAINAALFGADWFTNWLRQVQPLLEADAEINAVNEIAPIGFGHAVLGTDSAVALLAGGAVSVAVGLTLAWIWWRGNLDLGARFAITTAGLMLLGPHTIYYDSSILIFAVLLLLDRQRIDWWITALIWAAGFLQLTKTGLGASPLIFVVVAVFALAIRALAEPDAVDHLGSEPERVLPIHDS